MIQDINSLIIIMSIKTKTKQKKNRYIYSTKIMINIESKTWLDILPTEIIFLIFDYLSNNDIIYTFFHLNQRFNNLLLQNQQYFNYFELPIINLKIWKNILLIIGSKIECLNIIHPSLPLTYFSNLKTLIISAPYLLSNDQLKSLIENQNYTNLHSFKINSNKFFNQSLPIENDLFKYIFHHQNSLKIFQYSILISKFLLNNIISIQINNSNLHSLILNLIEFHQNIFLN